MTDQDTPAAGPWHISATIAGWLIPGLGHYLIGERSRGLILGISIGLLWLAGTLVGGVTVFDSKENRMWYLGQMLIAPSVVMNYYHHNVLAEEYGAPTPSDAPQPGFSPAYGRMQEQGLLYTSMAGLLNLLALVDVLYRDPNKPATHAPLTKPEAST